jgi:hypothetical protein
VLLAAVPAAGFALGERGASSPICEAGKGFVDFHLFTPSFMSGTVYTSAAFGKTLGCCGKYILFI